MIFFDIAYLYDPIFVANHFLIGLPNCLFVIVLCDNGCGFVLSGHGAPCPYVVHYL